MAPLSDVPTFSLARRLLILRIRQGAKCRMAAKTFDEMRSGADGDARTLSRRGSSGSTSTSPEKLAATRHEVDQFYRRHGITFGAYGAAEGAETTIPFDIIPRVIAWDEWEFLHKGLEQRVRALNAFLADAYGEREICRAGVIPEAQILMNAEFVAMAQGLRLPGDVHAHIAGIDLVRVGREGLLRAGGQCPHAVGRLLRAGEPRSDDAARARSCSRRCACCRSPTTPSSCWRPCARCRSATMSSPTSCC